MRAWQRKYAALRERSWSEHAAAEEFHKHLSLTPGFSQGFDNATKPLKGLNPVSVRNTGLKSGLTGTVRNYMSMVRELKCDMFQSA